MKASKHIKLLVALLVAGAFGAAQANVIFTDTFDEDTGAWYKAYTGGSAGTLTTDDERLSWTIGGTGGFEVIGRSFTPQTLKADGDYIELSFDFRQTSSAGIVRVGLYDLSGAAIGADNWASRDLADGETYAGYTTFVRQGSNLNNVARREDGEFSTATASNYPSYGVNHASGDSRGESNVTDIGTVQTNFTFQNDTDYQFTFRVTRTEEAKTDTLLTVMEGETERFSVAGSHTGSPHFADFNAVVLRTQSGTALFDNIQVSYIPEPGTAGLMAIFAGAALLLRRRLRK